MSWKFSWWNFEKCRLHTCTISNWKLKKWKCESNVHFLYLEVKYQLFLVRAELLATDENGTFVLSLMFSVFKFCKTVVCACVDYSGWCGLWSGGSCWTYVVTLWFIWWTTQYPCGDTRVTLEFGEWHTAHVVTPQCIQLVNSTECTGICVTISIHQGVLNCSISDHALCPHTFM